MAMGNGKGLKRLASSFSHPPSFPDGELHEHRCANCGYEYRGNYCPRCSQQAGDGRITWKWVGKSILDIWGMDSRSLPSTILQLLWRPGHLISDYIGGHRQICYKPVNMLFIVGLAYLAVMHLIGQDSSAVVLNLEGSPQSKYYSLFSAAYTWMADNPGWTIMIQTMLLILPTYLVFRYAPRNPHLTIPENIFIQLFMSTLMVLVSFTEIAGKWIPAILIPLYYYICYRQLFGYKFWGTCWRLAVCFSVWFVFALYLIVVVIVIGVYVSESSWTLLSVVAGLGILSLIVALATALPLALACLVSKKHAQHGSGTPLVDTSTDGA